MTNKMTLLYVEAVGQVAAALTRTSGPEEEVPAADLAGDALAVRSEPGEAEFAIPADQVAAAIVDRNDAVLLQPRRYRVVDGSPVEVGAKTLTIADAPGQLTLTLSQPPEDPPDAATSPAAAWVLIQDGLTAAPTVVTSQVPIDSPNVVIPIPVDSGDYEVLAIVAGYQPRTGPVRL